MNEMKKTITLVAIAVGLALLALLTIPRNKTPDVLSDVGQEFFPDFTDPNDAVSLEVISFDETAGQALPFKVEFKEGAWRIPSHDNYPAVGKDRLARTAAGLIGIRKDDFRTDNVAEHEACGVIDPLDDQNPGLKGRGQRITLKGQGDKLLADLIIGRPAAGAAGLRLVRVPGQKRVYAARINLDISTKFSDWIEPDLLKAGKDSIERVVVRDYTVDEMSRAVHQHDELALTRQGQGAWQAADLKAEQEINQARVEELLGALASFNLIDVRRKPEALAQGLKQGGGALAISPAEAQSLQASGFYFGNNGQLLANEGELVAETRDGVRYVLRFGEVAAEESQEAAAGAGDKGKEKAAAAGKPTENRYLFITAEFVPARLAEPEKPAELSFKDKPEAQWSEADKKMKQLADSHEAWQQQVEKAKKLASDLNSQFSDWYYVISGDNFNNLHLSRTDLLTRKQENKEAGKGASEATH